MPDEAQVEETEKSHLLVDLVKAATERKGSSGDGAPSSGSSLVVYLILAGIAVLGFSIMGFLLVRARRKAAKLAYELRKKEEEQKQAVENAQLEKNAEKREASNEKARKLQGEIDGLKKNLEDQKVVAASRAQALSDATTWDDLVIVDKKE